MRWITSRYGRRLRTTPKGVRSRRVDAELTEVLVTCDEDNSASRAVIEGAGGVYEDSRVGKRRYWVPTVTTDRPAGALIG